MFLKTILNVLKALSPIFLFSFVVRLLCSVELNTDILLTIKNNVAVLT